MRRLMTQFVIVMLAAATTMLYIESHLAPPPSGGSSAEARKLHSGAELAEMAERSRRAPSTDSRAGESSDQTVATAEEGQGSEIALTDGLSDSGASEPRSQPVTEGGLERRYGAMSRPEMREECESLSEQVMLTVIEESQKLMNSGRYEVVGYGTTAPSAAEDRTKLVTYQLVPVAGTENKEIRKIELLEADYPSTYELHRKAIWLSDRLRKGPRASE